MRSSSRILSALVCALCLACAVPAGAHHSFASVFDMSTQREIQGRITKLLWANPHVKIWIADRDGQTWEIEAGPVNLLSRIGIEKKMLPIGETIRVRGNPGRRVQRSLWVSNILLSNGTELLAAPDTKPYFKAKNTIGDSTVLSRAGALTKGDKRTFFRLWSPLITNFPRPRGAPALTEAGQRAQARYESGKQVVADCEVPGMPFAMMSPYPIEIVQKGDRLLIRGEAYDLTRVVYLSTPKPLPAPSPLGVSVGRITGDELIIETTRINYHSYGDLGPAQSNQSRVVERFTLSADGLALDYEITVTDPVMLREPWVWGGSFLSRKDAVIRPWNCGADRG